MRAAATFVTALALGLTAGCGEESTDPTDPDYVTVPAFGVAAEQSGAFRAHAHGGEEVPPVDTRAQGQASFRLSEDGSELHYRLNVANIHDVLQSHIHQAPVGENGPIVAWLYPSTPPAMLIPGRFQGVLAEGTITAADLVGPLEGMDLEALLDDLRSGNAYVNVHTSANPPGEIRGQIH